MKTVQHLIKLARRGWKHQHWYHEAHQAINEVADALEIEKSQVAQVLALMSPQTQLLRSVRLTASYLID